MRVVQSRSRKKRRVYCLSNVIRNVALARNNESTKHVKGNSASLQKLSSMEQAKELALHDCAHCRKQTECSRWHIARTSAFSLIIMTQNDLTNSAC